MHFFDSQEDVVFEIFKALSHHGQAYIVGGYVRDTLLKRPVSQDIDIEVYGMTLEELVAVLERFGDVLHIGKSFGVVKVTSLPHIDFALARVERKVGNKHQDFNVTFNKNMAIEEACRRRDLTINSILYDPLRNEYKDPNHGIEDLKHHILRCVDPTTFIEDPLRVLRVARFAGTFPDFKIDQETEKLCEQMVKDFVYLSKERIFNEYTRILMSDLPSQGFEFLKRIHGLPKEIEAMVTTHQRLDFHPEGSVFNHTMLVIDLAAECKHKVKEPMAFMWAALLHDIGKPSVTTPEGKAPAHDLKGEALSYHFMMDLSHHKQLSKYVSLMVRCHMVLMTESRRVQKAYPYLKVLSRFEKAGVPIEDLWMLSRCDKLGRKRIDHHSIEVFDAYIDKMKSLYGVKAPKPMITGKTLIDLGYKPDHRFKEILEKTYDKQLTGKMKEELVKYIIQNYPR